jgi:hypothetical protein
MRNLPMSPSRLGKDGIPVTCLEDGFALGGFKTLIGKIGLILGVCLILPCLVPLVLWFIKTIIKAFKEKKLAAHVMML